MPVFFSYFGPMSDFTLSLTADGIPYQFAFTHIKNPGAEKYFVSAQPVDADTVCFEMKKNYAGDWKVLEPLPAWIREWEATLSEFIRHKTS